MNPNPSVDFLKNLRKKLVVGNLRSIYLDVLPNRFITRLDLFDLKTTQENFDNLFLNKLFDETEFKQEISFKDLDLEKQKNKKLSSKIAKRLDAIYYENHDNFLEHGIEPFGFGFPMLIKKDSQDPTKSIKAPLLIWQLAINKSSKKQNTWKLSRKEEYAIGFNEVLVSHLLKNYNLDVSNLIEEVNNAEAIDQNFILEICQKLIQAINPNQKKIEIDYELKKCPTKKEFTQIPALTLHWAGVFALYKTPKQSLIKDIEQLIQNVNYGALPIEENSDKTPKKQFSTIAGVETDPSQEQILTTPHRSKIIQGPPGTGKSQSLTAIITNALENGRKTLVVCEKKTALEIIYQNLEALGLGKFCAVIDDISKDRKALVNSVRKNIEQNLNLEIDFKASDYQHNLMAYETLKKQINKRHKAVLQPAFGDMNWKDLIGKFLNRERQQSRAILKEKVYSGNYSFNFETFQKLSKIVQDGQFFYQQIQTLKHPFDLIDPRIFKGSFLNSLRFQLEQELNYLHRKASELNTQIETLKQQHGDKFDDNKVKLNLLSPIVPKFQELRKQTDKIYKDYQRLIEKHSYKKYFLYTFNLDGKVKSCQQIYEETKPYQNLLERLLAEMEGFKAYFEWKVFYFNLLPNEKELIMALIEADCKDWKLAFESWYFDGILMAQENELGPFLQNTHLLKKLQTVQQKLQNEQKNKIQNYWIKQQAKSVENFKIEKGNLKSLYNYRSSKGHGKRKSLRKIINTDFELFSNFFPVVLVNPSVCSSIIPLKENLFDYVLFDEASQLKLEDTYASFLRGKYRIISGDKHQMPPKTYFQTKEIVNQDVEEEEDDSDDFVDSTIDLAESDSLLSFADNADFEQTSLDFHYRSRHPFLIDFSNVAFYGSQLIPMPARSNFQPIRMVHLDGIYEENHTNPTEAKKIVDLLFRIKANKNGIYPSVGIATLNVHQRNLILNEIRKVCYENPAMAKKIQAIKKSGFFVKNLENIQGDEKDIVLFSTTFGLNRQGNFNQDFGPINQAKGYKLLNVAITRAKQRIYICTSIPKNYFENFETEIQEKGNIGKGIFYAYLAYAQAIENKDQKKRLGILRLLEDNCAEEKKHPINKKLESPFEKEVYTYLSKYIDSERILPKFQCGGFTIDFVIKSKTGKAILALQCDGADYYKDLAYAHELYRQKQIQKMGFVFHRIWSTSWWANPEHEAEKLAEFIDSVEKKLAEKTPLQV